MMKKCSVPGCDRKHLAKGLCALHYDRKRDGRSFEIKSRYELTAIDRIMEKVIILQNGCWIYTGKLTSKGYPHVRDDKGKMKFAYRIVFEHHKGPVPDGFELDHLCKRRACCNPEHFETLSHRENIIRGNSGHDWKNRFRDPISGRFI